MWRLCPFLLKSPGTGIDQDHHSTAQFNLQQKNQIHHDQVDFKTDVPTSAKTVHTATAVCAHPLSPRRSPDLLKTMLFPFFCKAKTNIRNNATIKQSRSDMCQQTPYDSMSDFASRSILASVLPLHLQLALDLILVQNLIHHSFDHHRILGVVLWPLHVNGLNWGSFCPLLSPIGDPLARVCLPRPWVHWLCLHQCPPKNNVTMAGLCPPFDKKQ